MDAAAQAQPEVAVNPENQTPQQSAEVQVSALSENQSAGIQKRIDELTARIYDEARLRAVAEERAAATTQTLAEVLARQAAPQVSAPALPSLPEGVDPQFKTYFDSLMHASLSPVLGKYENVLKAQQAEIAQLKLKSGMAAEPEPVQKRAMELMTAWTKNGNSGWIPEDAVAYAYGELYRQGKLAPAGYVRQNTTVAAAPLPAAPPPVTAPRPAAEEPDFDFQDPNQAVAAEAYYRKKLGRK